MKSKTNNLSAETFIGEVKKIRKRRTDPSTKALELIFENSKDLLVKLNAEADKGFRTPAQQLVYYTWKCIDFMK